MAAIADELGGDVIVCATHGRGALAGALLGSFTHRLLHVARCPVLVVPHAHVRSERETLERHEVRA